MNVGDNDKNWMEGSLKDPLLRGSWEAELLWPAMGPPWVSSESAESHQMLSPRGRSVDPSTHHLVPVLTLGSAELIRDKTDSSDTVFMADLLAGGKRGQKYNTNIFWDSSVLFGSFSSFLEEFSLQELSLRQLLPRRQAWMPASPGALRWEEACGRVPQHHAVRTRSPREETWGWVAKALLTLQSFVYWKNHLYGSPSDMRQWGCLLNKTGFWSWGPGWTFTHWSSISA